NNPRYQSLILTTVSCRDEANVSVPQKIVPAIPEVSDHRRAARDRRRDQRRGRSLLSALAGGAEHRVVRAPDRGREGLRGGHRASSRAEKALRERVDRGGARELASGLAADAVGHREKRRITSFAHEVAVFVVLANTSSVGACRRLRSQP